MFVDAKTIRDAPVPPAGPGARIDVHCHLIPGIDDGCRTLAESLQCVEMTAKAGYAGAILTPHVWPETFPDITIAAIEQWTVELQAAIDREMIDFRVWPGGEVRLHENIVHEFETLGVPTMASSNAVLTDFWTRDWPDWADEAFDWLLREGYQPLLAHPERLAVGDELIGHLDRIVEQGVLLQGNLRCTTGDDGPLAKERYERWLPEGRYHVLGLDTHHPRDLKKRLQGLNAAPAFIPADEVNRLTTDVPRELFLANNPVG